MDKAESCCYISYFPDDEFFECSICGAEFSTIENAKDCCDHSRKVYTCPICEEPHTVEGNAMFCCPRDFDSLWQMRVDPRVLEKYGQLRLPF
jgi:hypothetical protein